MERREFLGALTALGAIGLAPTETQASPPMVTNRRFHLAGIETKVGNLEVPSLDSFTLLSVTTPGSMAPVYLFACTWEDPSCKEIEEYVRLKALPRELQSSIRSFVKSNW
jgi:hypothetical protein